MAKLIAAAATSHAFALVDPSTWDERRISNQEGFRRRYGFIPETRPEVEQETDEDLRYRYGAVSRGHDLVRDRFEAADLDALIIIGDDQDEAFTEQTLLPQLAIYTGKEFTTRSGSRYQSADQIALHIYNHTVDAGFDLLQCGSFPDDFLRGHAFGPVLDRLTPKMDVPVIPIFVEAIHLPSPSPARCFAFGQAMARAIDSWPGGERIGVIASGGISHITQSYPYKYVPAVQHGTIHTDFDRVLFQLMSDGKGEDLAKLTNQDLLDHGDPELHAWITLLGMVGSAKADILAYEPFFRAIMAMGVAYWDVSKTEALSMRTPK